MSEQELVKKGPFISDTNHKEYMNPFGIDVLQMVNSLCVNGSAECKGSILLTAQHDNSRARRWIKHGYNSTVSQLTDRQKWRPLGHMTRHVTF